MDKMLDAGCPAFSGISASLQLALVARCRWLVTDPCSLIPDTWILDTGYWILIG